MNFKSAPSYSLSKSLKKSITQMVPHNPIAPGPIYNVSGLGQREPNLSHSIGRSKRTEINHRVEETPSPLHYEPKHPTLTKHLSIPQSSYLETPNFNPDPSCYIPEEKHTIRKVLAYTLSSRDPSIMDQVNKNPGPADYQNPADLPILSRSKNVKQASFGTGSRFKYEVDQNPGTGHYSANSNKLSQFQRRYSIGKADRYPSIECTPGPSEYPKASFIEQNIKGKLGKSLGQRFKSSIINEATTTINAFHKYHENPESLFAASKKSPTFSIGKQKRQFLNPNPNPGPAQYINDQFLTKHSSTAFIPRSEHVEYSDTVLKPGPGTYQIEEEKGPKYSFSRSKSLATVSTTIAPGVGRYQLQSLKFEKGAHFSKSNRFRKQEPSVGVGQYNLAGNKEHLVMEKALKSSMSRSSRFKNHQEYTPGPGDYHIQSLISIKGQMDK